MNIKAIAHRPAKVICLGEILIDYLAQELDKSPSEITSWTPYPGGAPANVACALVKLGTPSAFIGCVGRDIQGKELVRLLESTGVNTYGVQYSDLHPTRKVYVTRTANGDRSFAGFGDHQADEFADAHLLPQYIPSEIFLEAEYLVLGTLELAYPQSRAAILHALELAEEYHLKIVLDINWRPVFWLDQQDALPLIKKLFPYIDFLKLAQEEAQWLFNTVDAGEISHLLGSVEGVLVSNGEAEVSYCINDHEGMVKPIEVKVEDTTGAGDAFLAGLVHQLCLQGVQKLGSPQVVKDIVHYACAVGGLSTTKLGALAAQPSAAEVKAFLQKNQQNQIF